MTQIRIWGVLGAGGVGKSTTVGHLIGDFGKGKGGLRPGPGGIRQILLRGGGHLTVFGRRSSWQEAKKTPQQVAQIVKRQCSQISTQNPAITIANFNILMALRTDKFRNFPVATDYLSNFVKLGWHIESLALLSPSDTQARLYSRFGAPVCIVNDSLEIRFGWMVGQVRNHFGWA
jgi:hypothetical protein